MRTAVTRRRRRRHRPWRSASAPAGPSRWAYKGSGNPGGGRSHQGLDTSRRMPSSRRKRTNRFFGGSGSGPSRGAFPFSSTENRCIGAIAARQSSGKDEEVAEEDELEWLAPFRTYSQGRPTVGFHDRR